MRGLRLLSLSVLFISLMVPAAASFPMAKPGCNETCGNGVKIPYPFGIGRRCAFNESYTIYCNGSSPFLRFQILNYSKNVTVLEVSLSAQTITLHFNRSQICQNEPYVGWGSLSLTGSPFYYSGERNKLMLLGCGNVRLYQGYSREGSVLSGCTSMCELGNSISGCYGTNCCEANIPFYLTNYDLGFKNLEFSNTTGYTCASAFLVDQKWNPENYSDLFLPRSKIYFPVVLFWILKSQSDVDTITGCKPKMSYIPVDYTLNITNYRCECDILGNGTWFYGINPYLDGACNYAISQIRGSGKKHFKAAIVGASVGVGVLFLMLSGFALYKVIKKRRNKKRKEKFFKRNGGLLLQQQLSTDEGGIEKTMIFTAKELNKASDGFNENRIVGQGGQGTVYKGMLTDGRIVAIKMSKKVDESQLEQFINEVVILSQVNHRNVVKLLGTCLEIEVPLLVYEFIPNGTLFSLIHNGNDDEFPLTWNLRLRIATEVAGALAYLHSAVWVPIYHRDIKSSNILLDEKYRAKVSDFGISRSVAMDKTHLTTNVKGTFGYLDPEFFQSSQFTDKSDVYSFGVVLVELLTRQKPVSFSKTEEDGNLSLATRFLESMEKNSLNTILDPQIIDQKYEEQIVAVAKLAQQCLNLNGKKRPTMKEAAVELENITKLNVDSTIQTNFPNPSCFGGDSTLSVDSNYTWTRTTESESFAPALADYPLLCDTA